MLDVSFFAYKNDGVLDWGLSLKAFAVFAGGGVKGAAHAGCLMEAHERGVQFEGYAGTSAGSIIALLAAIGYPPDQIKEIAVKQMDLASFLPDGGRMLADGREQARKLVSGDVGLCSLRKLKKSEAFKAVNAGLGLYDSHQLKEFLRKKIVALIPEFADRDRITFRALAEKGCKPLKIIASDVRRRQAQMFSTLGGSEDVCVLDAVAASTCYPFVFKPVRIDGGLYVDGGLASNLPVFSFEDERRVSRYPVLAFDLFQAGSNAAPGNVPSYVKALLDTALEASEKLIRSSLSDLHYIRIEIPGNVDTFNMNLAESDRAMLFDRGKSDTSSYLNVAFPYLSQMQSAVQSLQAMHVEAAAIEPILSAICNEISATFTGASDLRVYVILPYGGAHHVTYQHGMDNDADQNLSFRPKSPLIRTVGAVDDFLQFINFTDLRGSLTDLGISASDVARLRKDRQTAVSVPIFKVVGRQAVKEGPRELIGTLCIDTSTEFAKTGWVNANGAGYLTDGRLPECLMKWSQVLGRLLV